MLTIKFKLNSNDKKQKPLSGIYIECDGITQIIFEKVFCGSVVHPLTQKNVKHVGNLIASYLVRIDEKQTYNTVVTLSGDKTVETEIQYEIEKPSKELKFYKVPSVDSYVPSSTVLNATVNGTNILISAEDIKTDTIYFPVDNKYCKNDEINKYAAEFGVDVRLFKSQGVASILSYFIKELRDNKADTLIVPLKQHSSKVQIHNLLTTHDRLTKYHAGSRHYKIYYRNVNPSPIIVVE